MSVCLSVCLYVPSQNVENAWNYDFFLKSVVLYGKTNTALDNLELILPNSITSCGATGKVSKMGNITVFKQRLLVLFHVTT